MLLLVPVLRYAFLAGLLVFVARVTAAVLADLGARPVASSPARALLVAEAPEGMRGREFLVSGDTVIGRAPGCAIVLSDDYVSSRHARIVERGGRVWVEDLGSTNGTLLNGRPVRRAAALRAGDRLQLGRTVLAFRVEPPVGPPARAGAGAGGA